MICLHHEWSGDKIKNIRLNVCGVMVMSVHTYTEKVHKSAHSGAHILIDADICCHTNAMLHIDTYADNKHK